MRTIKLLLIIAAVLCVAGLIMMNILWMNEMEEKRLEAPVAVKTTDRAGSGLSQSEQKTRVESSAMNKPSAAQVAGGIEPMPDSPVVERETPEGGSRENPVPDHQKETPTAKQAVPPAVQESRDQTTPELTEEPEEAGSLPERDSDGTIIVTIKGKGGQKPTAYRPPLPQAGTGNVIPPVMPRGGAQYPTSTSP